MSKLETLIERARAVAAGRAGRAGRRNADLARSAVSARRFRRRRFRRRARSDVLKAWQRRPKGTCLPADSACAAETGTRAEVIIYAPDADRDVARLHDLVRWSAALAAAASVHDSTGLGGAAHPSEAADDIGCSVTARRADTASESTARRYLVDYRIEPAQIVDASRLARAAEPARVMRAGRTSLASQPSANAALQSLTDAL